MTKINKTHGGKRPGAGRKVIGRQNRQRYTMTLDPAFLAQLDVWAKKNGLSRSEAANSVLGLFLKLMDPDGEHATSSGLPQSNHPGRISEQETLRQQVLDELKAAGLSFFDNTQSAKPHVAIAAQQVSGLEPLLEKTPADHQKLWLIFESDYGPFLMRTLPRVRKALFLGAQRVATEHLLEENPSLLVHCCNQGYHFEKQIFDLSEAPSVGSQLEINGRQACVILLDWNTPPKTSRILYWPSDVVFPGKGTGIHDDDSLNDDERQALKRKLGLAIGDLFERWKRPRYGEWQWPAAEKRKREKWAQKWERVMKEEPNVQRALNQLSPFNYALAELVRTGSFYRFTPSHLTALVCLSERKQFEVLIHLCQHDGLIFPGYGGPLSFTDYDAYEDEPWFSLSLAKQLQAPRSSKTWKLLP